MEIKINHWWIYLVGYLILFIIGLSIQGLGFSLIAIGLLLLRGIETPVNLIISGMIIAFFFLIFHSIDKKIK